MFRGGSGWRAGCVGRDGSTVTVSLTMSPIIGAAGVVVGAASTSRRFSELQEARDRFEIRMAQLRAEASAAQILQQVRV